MEIHYTKIIESIVVIALFLVIKIVTNSLINRTIIDKVVQNSRSQLIRKAINFIMMLICVTILMIIWGVKQSDLVIFVGSILTIVGVAFFAQWSLLSNITSSIILFFGHSVKIGDYIVIMETKDYEISGEILNIGLFFTNIKMKDTDEEITLPNNIFIQKTMRKVNPHTNSPQDIAIIKQEIL
jgi:small-conductance mechanosensitive channel|tara:strand:- start:64570 stop:65118 length:549 start_codon:yes stop_codon:yes gene_type:complete